MRHKGHPRLRTHASNAVCLSIHFFRGPLSLSTSLSRLRLFLPRPFADSTSTYFSMRAETNILVGQDNICFRNEPRARPVEIRCISVAPATVGPEWLSSSSFIVGALMSDAGTNIKGGSAEHAERRTADWIQRLTRVKRVVISEWRACQKFRATVVREIMFWGVNRERTNMSKSGSSEFYKKNGSRKN